MRRRKVVGVPLGAGIGDFVGAVRDRVEVSWHHDTWHVTAGSFESALAYARNRFEEPVVLARRDRGRRWQRVTLTISTDPAAAATAPSLETLARPAVPPPREAVEPALAPAADLPADPASDPAPDPDSDLPEDLEAIFASQDVPQPRRRRR